MTFENKNYTILINQSIRLALEKINKSGLRSIVVVNNKNKMKGVVTDGDIRRAVLKGIKLNEKIYKIYNFKPLYVTENKISNENLKNIFLNKKVDIIPVVDDKKKLKRIIKISDFFYNKINLVNEKKNPIVLMAGGLGTRLSPFTNILPKALMPLNGKPIIDHILQSFFDQKYLNFYLCLKHQSEIIKAYLKKIKNIKINYINEKKPLGTSGALRLLKNKINTDFFLTNCDVLFNVNFDDVLSFHKKNKNDITLVASEKEYKIQYGVCRLNKSGHLINMIEKPTFDYFVNVGLYLMSKKILKIIPNSYLDVPDLIRLAKKKHYKISVYIISNNSWLDVGQWDDFNLSSEKIKNFKNS